MNFISKFSDFSLQGIWNIGFVDDSLDVIINGSSELSIHWMQHEYEDRWFADPFILDVSNDRIKVLVEEYIRKDKKARISLLTLDRHDYRLLKIDAVIKENTHLSFPFISRKGGVLSIIPENGEAGVLSQYLFNQDRLLAEYEKDIYDGYLADAVLLNVKGEDILAATSLPDPSGKDLLLLKKSDDGHFHLWKTITFPRKVARNAGDWFDYKGKLYRPAQDCDLRYGSAMELQEMDIERGIFRTVRRFVPTSSKYNLGLHTFNSYNGFSVVDGYGYRRPVAAKLYSWVSNTFHKIIGSEYRIK